MRLKPLLQAALLAALSGCAGPSSGPRSAAGGAQAASEEAAIASALNSIEDKKGGYKINPADLLKITVYRNQDLDREIRVNQDGTVSLPLAGSVAVGGLTVVQAEKALSDKYRDYVVSPQVTIFIKEYGNKRVFVFGQVTKPGSYELPTESKMTVLGAVSMAGGFTPIAAPDRTRVIRKKDGRSETIVVEVSAVTRRGEKEKDIALEPDDVVYVPQSYF